MTPNDRTVGVLAHADGARDLVWQALEGLLPVTFRRLEADDDWGGCDGIVLLAGGSEEISKALASCRWCYDATRPTMTESDGSGDSEVRFGDTPDLDPRLRNRRLRHRKIDPGAVPADVAPGASVLASCDGIPVWSARQTGDSRLDSVALQPPQLDDGEMPLDYMNGGNFLRLLPLIHFARRVAQSDPGWRPPPLRACFMFDDPNLHAMSYGFLGYHELVKLSHAERFHVSFATVPLDGWYVDGKAARLFRDNRDQVSLLIHGNNHRRAELARFETAEEERRGLAQALRRVARIEKKSGLRICRVMAPPHGASSNSSLEAMGRLGYEGACISPWSLRAWGATAGVGPAFGLRSAEIYGAGFSVIPRFRLSEHCHGDCLIAAFLDRPIVPVGHHDSVADGLEIMSDLARWINSFGDVRWSRTSEIIRTNYHGRLVDSTFEIRPFATRCAVSIPPGAATIRVLGERGLNYVVRGLNGTRLQTGGGRIELETGIETAVPERAEIEVGVAGHGSWDYQRIPRPGLSLWLPLRRFLCEARDRVRPLIGR